ncbi:MAG: ParA family protein [Clostridia bacterium]|nr:ParA family protein [Clostridia bacterium]
MTDTVVIAFANQKGGVGKTTSAVNVAAALGLAGHPTLLLDLDPQGNSTSGVGVNKRKIRASVYEVLSEKCSPAEAVVKTPFKGLSVMPSTMSLAAADLELAESSKRQGAVRDLLEALRGQYEFVIIDCPPSLSMLTVNALAAADGVVIPMQCEYYALEGLTQLMTTIKIVKQRYNPDLTITGILVTMHNGRLNLSVQVLEELKKYYSDKLFPTAITRSVRLSEAPSFGKPIFYYDPHSKGAQQYTEVASEIVRRVR